MATKMVLRKQTGHICNECKMSFKAKELLLEHNETCPGTKGIFRPIETKFKLPGHETTETCQISPELGALLVSDSIYVPQIQVNDAENVKSNEVVENVCFPTQYEDVLLENDVNKVLELSEEVIVKSNLVGGHEPIIPDNCVTIQDQPEEQTVASLVDVTNVENFFDNDVCAFEVIEETVEETFSQTDIKHSHAIYSADCMKKLNKKRRLNSGSSGVCEVGNNSSNNSSNSSCNNPSVYSLCLAAELASTMETAQAAKLASSMETVQAAKSLLGMSLQQGEVETDDSGNIKMVSILRKKSELVSQMPENKDLMISSQTSVGIKREIGDHHILPSGAITFNVNSKISFLQSLNKWIVGKETDGAAFSDLITEPVTCDPKVKVEMDGDESLIPEKKFSKMNFNVLKSSNTNTMSLNAKAMGTRNAFASQNATRPVYPLHNQSNVFKKRQPLLPAFIGHDATLIPVTNEVEVIADIEKSEVKPFNTNFQGRQYVIQVPTNLNNATNLSPITNQMVEAKESNLYVCGVCSKAFDDCETLKLHVEKHIGMERQNSNKMKGSDDKLSDDESVGDDEGDDVHKNLGTKHECRECGSQFARFSILKRHAKIEHGGLKAYVCGACNKTFPFACGLKLHAHTHGAERRYSCQFCGRRFKHASNLQKHVKVTHINACKCRTVDCTCGKRDLTSFKIDHACRICGRVCESSKHLEIHHRSHTGEKPEVCQTCGKSFQHKSNLQKHQLKHTGIRPYKCSHCDRSFFVKHSFLGHMRLHTRDSPYTCETCGKSFISKNGLQVHSILHQDHLPFRCGQCGREFAQLGNLNKHLSLHTGDKPFPCNYCEKKFVDTSALKRHMVIHTRERNYSCPECGKTFLHFSSLRSHMTTHKFEEQEKHQCNICNKIFTVKSNYIRHMKQHEEGPSSESEQIEYLVYMQ